MYAKLQFMHTIEDDFLFSDSDIPVAQGSNVKEVVSIIGKQVLANISSQVKGLGIRVTNQDNGANLEDEGMLLVHIIDEESRKMLLESYAVITLWDF